MNAIARTLVGAVFMTISSGCSFRALSPPARVVMLENAQALARNETAVSVEGGIGGFVFSRYATYGTLRARRGMAANVEGAIDVTAGYVDGGRFDCEVDATECRAGNARGGGGAMRLGAKWAPWGKHFAVTGGLGAGGSLFGGMFALDAGIIASFDNPYVIPFFTTSVGLSVPFSARTLHFGDSIDRATPTFVWPMSLGLKVPLSRAESGLRGAILGGIGALYLHDGHNANAAGLVSLGGEVVF